MYVLRSWTSSSASATVAQPDPAQVLGHRARPHGDGSRQEDVPVVPDRRKEMQLRRPARAGERAMIGADGVRAVVSIVLRIEPQRGEARGASRPRERGLMEVDPLITG